MSWYDTVKLFFTPDHKKQVEEHLIRDTATRSLIEDTEDFLRRIAENPPSSNEKRTIRRKQKEWTIKVKVKHTTITIIMMDQKHSTSPIKKRFVIVCYRKYMKAHNGVGLCKEATIRYTKDGRAQIRSIRESPLFHTIFYRIHQIDLAYSNETASTSRHSKELLSSQQSLLQETSPNNVAMLLEESRRYVQAVKQFSLDPVIESRLTRLLQQADQLKEDFLLLDFEERHIVRRMFKDDIPSLIHTYLSLSVKHQLEQKENLYITLTKMELTLIDYVDRLEKLRVDRMNHLLRLQSIRYDK